ncbi:MAG: hypothetical protein AVDCRST_MAG57-2526, partial [uncultured Blastococcus sp.]
AAGRRPGGVLRQLRAGPGRRGLPVGREVPRRERHDHRVGPEDGREGHRPADARACDRRRSRGRGLVGSVRRAAAGHLRHRRRRLDRLGAGRSAHRAGVRRRVRRDGLRRHRWPPRLHQHQQDHRRPVRPDVQPGQRRGRPRPPGPLLPPQL